MAIREMVRIDEEKCTSCKLCYNVCPGWGVNIQKFANKLFKNHSNDEERWQVASVFTT